MRDKIILDFDSNLITPVQQKAFGYRQKPSIKFAHHT